MRTHRTACASAILGRGRATKALLAHTGSPGQAVLTKRVVQTFEERPLDHIIESETVDYDNRSFAFSVFGHEDPAIVTVIIGKEQRTLSRDAHTEGLTRLLDAIKRVPPAR